MREQLVGEALLPLLVSQIDPLFFAEVADEAWDVFAGLRRRRGMVTSNVGGLFV